MRNHATRSHGNHGNSRRSTVVAATVGLLAVGTAVVVFFGW